MHRAGIRHLGVIDDEGRLVGALSMRDLLRLRAQGAVNLGDAIEAAGDAGALGQSWGMLPAVARALVREEVPAREIAAVISAELGTLTGRVARLAEAELAAEGFGPAPRAYAVLILGSAGRGESLLAMDQDNALVYADGPEPDEGVDPWFAALGTRVARMLDAVGVPLCKGGVMASNAAFRGSVATWTARSAEWVRRARPQDLLNVDIFFDLRPVHGDAALAGAILDAAFANSGPSLAFAKLMADKAAGGSPFTLFGGLREDEGGRVDLKGQGLLPIVSAARAIAVRHDIRARSTPDRLAVARARGIGSEEDLLRLDDAHRVLVERVLAQQIEDVAAGLPPSNRIEARRLAHRDRDALRGAMRAAAGAGAVARDLMLAGL
jgi:DNA polymerase-3 subunit epsilon/CBS domain-containing protein